MVSAPGFTKTTVLVVVGPGLLRDSLLAFLEATPDLGVVGLVDDPAVARKALRRQRPQMLVLDAELDPQAMLSLVRQLYTEAPAPKFVVLVNSLWQQRAFLAAGAADVLLKGSLDGRLRAAILGGAGSDLETMNDESGSREQGVGGRRA